MTPILRRVAQVLSAAWCVPALAADPSAFQLRLDPVLGEAAAGQVEGRPVYGRGDRLTGRTDREVTIEGDAELRRAGTVVRGDRITYYETDDEVVAVGNVRVVRQGNVFTGPELQLKLDASEGFFASPTYTLPLYGGHGRADRVEFLGPDRLVLTNATYTTCRPENPDWYLRAESLTLDQDQDEGSGRSASLYFKDRRILAAPLFGFSLGERAQQRAAGADVFVHLERRPRAAAALLLEHRAEPGLHLLPAPDGAPGTAARRAVPLPGAALLRRPARRAQPERRDHGHAAGTSGARCTTSPESRAGAAASTRGASRTTTTSSTTRARSSPAPNGFCRATRLSFAADGNWTFLARATRYQSILDARATPPYERVPQLSATQPVASCTASTSTRCSTPPSSDRPLVGATEGVRGSSIRRSATRSCGRAGS